MKTSDHETTKIYRRKKAEAVNPGVVIGSFAAAGALALAYGLASSNPVERTPEGPAKIIDTAVQSHNLEQMLEKGVAQLNGSAVVAIDGNVRTSPIVSNDDGFENISGRYTDLAAATETTVFLENPYIVDDPSSEVNGVWYGAEDPDTHEVYWVNERAISEVVGTATQPSGDLKSYIYTMPSLDQNK